MSSLLIEAKHITKVYLTGEVTIRALDGVSFSVGEGEFVSIMGQSGSGKSTLLQILGLIDKPSSGQLCFNQQATEHLSDNQLTDIRLRHIGFVHQAFHLVPTLTAVENIALPLLLQNLPKKIAYAKAREMLDLVHLRERADHYPNQLSGGQMQRVAIARATVADPSLILADEPTGNLDSKSGEEILHLLQRLNREQNKTIVMVTHSQPAAEYGTRIIEMKDGRILEERSVTRT